MLQLEESKGSLDSFRTFVFLTSQKQREDGWSGGEGEMVWAWEESMQRSKITKDEASVQRKAVAML